MAEANLDQLRERLDGRAGELQRAQKQLQRPSTLSFVERRDLAARAGKALTELREHRAALEGKSDGEDGLADQIKEVETALERAEEVLGSAGGGSGRGPRRTAGGTDRRMPGQTRGASGPPQQRPPDRKGGE